MNKTMIDTMFIGNRRFEIGRHTYIMGILNLTPDSFSDGGSYKDTDAALFRVETMLKEGADIIDVGGESTRPGHIQISENEEIERTASAIERIRARFDAPISIDTYKSKVAEAALNAGADLVNDIWGFKYDPQMATVVKAYDAACCLMHNKDNHNYEDLIGDCLRETKECIDIAKHAGIADEKIMIDPGIGFGLDYTQCLQVLKEMDRFNTFGYPVLLGTSRKSCIGLTLDTDVKDRAVGTAATTVMGVMAGMAFVRVHDIKVNAQAIKMTEAIINA